MSKIKISSEYLYTFDELYMEFITSCKLRNLSASTLIYYKDCYLALAKYKPIIYLHEIDNNFINGYIIHLQQGNVTFNTVNTRLRGLRAMLNYASDHGYIDQLEVKLLKVDKQVKQTYSTEQIKILLKKPNIKHCSFATYRNWVLINWFVGTGNRLSTVTNILVGDLDLSNKLVTLRHTKNRTQQVIPLSSRLCIVLAEYISLRDCKPTDYLFPSENNCQLTKDGITSAIKDYNNARGIQLASIHAFRRYFAKQLVLNGVDTFTLQKLGGWKDLTVVKNYVEIYASDIRDYESINPLDMISSSNRIKLSKK